jgi:cyclopropane-fatty-acyl-phospholipid synthase
MFAKKAQKWFQDLIRPAGITLNGQRPYDIQVHSTMMFNRILLKGFLGLGESYMDGQWDCQQLGELFFRLLRAKVDESAGNFLPELLDKYRSKLMNLQSKSRAFIVGERHYDLGNDLYTAMLGPTMAYSCGYYENTARLDQAQTNKYDLVCRKMQLVPGSTVLEIGCGWGSFAKYATENYGVKIIGLTVSKEQAAYARELCSGLPVEILVMDYRDFSGKVDAIVSIGMFEHVGVKNYPTFFEVARKCLSDDGLFLLHTLGNTKPMVSVNPWMKKYIFPNAAIPSLSQITAVAEKHFVIEDVHNFGADYGPTLMAWHANYHRALANGSLSQERYGGRFQRMWDFYLLSCVGASRARDMQLYQLVLSPRGVLGGYESVR